MRTAAASATTGITHSSRRGGSSTVVTVRRTSVRMPFGPTNQCPFAVGECWTRAGEQRRRRVDVGRRTSGSDRRRTPPGSRSSRRPRAGGRRSPPAPRRRSPPSAPRRTRGPGRARAGRRRTTPSAIMSATTGTPWVANPAPKSTAATAGSSHPSRSRSARIPTTRPHTATIRPTFSAVYTSRFRRSSSFRSVSVSSGRSGDRRRRPSSRPERPQARREPGRGDPEERAHRGERRGPEQVRRAGVEAVQDELRDRGRVEGAPLKRLGGHLARRPPARARRPSSATGRTSGSRGAASCAAGRRRSRAGRRGRPRSRAGPRPAPRASPPGARRGGPCRRAGAHSATVTAVRAIRNDELESTWAMTSAVAVRPTTA